MAVAGPDRASAERKRAVAWREEVVAARLLLWERPSRRGAHRPISPRPSASAQFSGRCGAAGPWGFVLDTAATRPASTDATPAQVEGALEGFLGTRSVLGWAADPARPGLPVTLLLRLRGAEIGRLVTGGQDRPELRAAGLNGERGFVLDLPDGYAAGDLATGRLAVHPLRDGAPQPPLPPRPRLVAQEQVAAGQAMLSRAEEVLGPQGLAEMLALLGRPEGFGAARLAREANAALGTGLAGARPADVPLSALTLPVGLRSPTGGVVLGRDGHLFLLAGSNGEIMRLGRDPAQCMALVEAWVARIAERRARAEALGIHFIQLIVPEKASLVPELLPDPAQGGPSPFLTALEEAIAARPDLAACTVSGLSALRDAAGERPEALVRRLDSHPSALGMHVLARAVLQRLGEETPDLGERFRRRSLAEGDLGVHFLATPCLEETAHVPSRAFARFGMEPELVASHVPPDGVHIGRWEAWRTRRAPSKRRALVFGNSVCGSAQAGQSLLSGWLARWFAKYRFQWQPAVDWALVESERPDVLMCQTVERFMGRVPEA